MITITFHKSKSIRYKEALKMALFFKSFKQEEEYNTIEMPLKEIIEKWEWFCLLFWLVLDWKGTSITYEGITYYSHTDKTKIFYAVQTIHCDWMNYTSTKLIKSYKIVPPKSKLLEEDPEKLTDEQLNHLIDVMVTKIHSRNGFEEKMKDIEKMIREGY